MNKKAFTLAEVLITLSILGVVAALTIPSLVNRQSDLAAQTKLKKAIASYETAVAVHMAETEAADATAMMGTNCANAENYFKIVGTKTAGTGGCSFKTADGAFWVFNSTNGNAIVYDTDDSPRYGVYLWNANGHVNSYGTADGGNNVTTTSFIAAPTGITLPTVTNGRFITTAPLFMQGSNSDAAGKLYCASANATITANGAASATCASS